MNEFTFEIISNPFRGTIYRIYNGKEQAYAYVDDATFAKEYAALIINRNYTMTMEYPKLTPMCETITKYKFVQNKEEDKNVAS